MMFSRYVYRAQDVNLGSHQSYYDKTSGDHELTTFMEILQSGPKSWTNRQYHHHSATWLNIYDACLHEWRFSVNIHRTAFSYLFDVLLSLNTHFFGGFVGV